jgi:hypothetical protein
LAAQVGQYRQKHNMTPSSKYELSEEENSMQLQQGLVLPYPALAGRLQQLSDGQQVVVLPARSSDHIHRVFMALAGFAVDEYRLKTTFKLKDRYGDWWLENHFQTEGQVWRLVA